MARIGLFPLELVLVPTERVPLNVFEPRYTELVGECLERQEEFGIVLVKPSGDVHHVGTRAAIVEVLQVLPDGRMHIVVEGGDRFRLLEVDHERSFDTGSVEELVDQDDPPDPADLERAFETFKRWNVPAQYNIAADVCDKHPRDKPAMIWESFDGSVRELAWGELQDLANQAAHTLAARGVKKGERVAVLLPPTPETAAVFFGAWKLGAVLLSMSVLYGDEAVRHRLTDSEAKVVVTDAANAPRFENASAEMLLVEEGSLAGAPTDHICEPTSADDPAQLYYTSGTTGLANGIVHAHRYLLAHEAF